MSLPYYGLLTGRLEKYGPQHGGNPHYLLYVHAGSVLYRVAVNTGRFRLPFYTPPLDAGCQVVSQ
ncbi:MAG TPA: hypothetical protein VK775_08940 [Chthoniobacterales bacterium]|jgi:hypothetical protein|nr:hypothetical protein [Chthoniobacterales bacterium]